MSTTAEKRKVVLFQELDPSVDDLSKQNKIGVMSHWEAKKYVYEQPDNQVFFTVSKTIYDSITKSASRNRRKRRTKAEMQAFRAKKAS